MLQSTSKKISKISPSEQKKVIVWTVILVDCYPSYPALESRRCLYSTRTSASVNRPNPSKVFLKLQECLHILMLQKISVSENRSQWKKSGMNLYN